MSHFFKYQPRTDCICGAALDSSGSAITKVARYGEVRFVRCSNCGSYIQSPQITTESLKEWYDSDHYQGGSGQTGSAYIDYESDEAARICEAKVRFRRQIAPFLPPKARVLEIGCATGSLLSVIREEGHSVSGIDLSPRFAEAARRLHGLDVKAGDFMNLRMDQDAFDAVILLGTVSNMQDLPAAMGKIRTLLNDNGVVLFNFPHADSMIARLYGQDYWMFAPSVSSFMTVAGCRKMLQRLGFSIAKLTFDIQQPSIGKLLHHGKVDRWFPALIAKWGSHPIPIALPIPAITLVRATKDSTQKPVPPIK